MMNIQNYIGGKFISAVDSETLFDYNPATEQHIATIPRSKKEDVQLAVTAAQSAQQDWGA